MDQINALNNNFYSPDTAVNSNWLNPDYFFGHLTAFFKSAYAFLTSPLLGSVINTIFFVLAIFFILNMIWSQKFVRKVFFENSIFFESACHICTI